MQGRWIFSGGLSFYRTPMQHLTSETAMKRLLSLSLVLFCLLLSGCGTHYAVSVDSLCDSQPPSGPNCLLVPGDADVSDKDLLFREISSLVAPAFKAKGWNLILNRDAAQTLVKLSWDQEEPRTVTDITYITRSYPIYVGRGRYRHVEYVYYDEPVLSTYTIYTVNLLLEGWELDKGRETGRQVWRTALRSSGVSDDVRTRIFSMVQVLPLVLGTGSGGLQRYTVVLDDGEVSIRHEGPGGL